MKMGNEDSDCRRQNLQKNNSSVFTSMVTSPLWSKNGTTDRGVSVGVVIDEESASTVSATDGHDRRQRERVTVENTTTVQRWLSRRGVIVGGEQNVDRAVGTQRPPARLAAPHSPVLLSRRYRVFRSTLSREINIPSHHFSDAIPSSESLSLHLFFFSPFFFLVNFSPSQFGGRRLFTLRIWPANVSDRAPRPVRSNQHDSVLRSTMISSEFGPRFSRCVHRSNGRRR
jgi:hypothetical protein